MSKNKVYCGFCRTRFLSQRSFEAHALACRRDYFEGLKADTQKQLTTMREAGRKESEQRGRWVDYNPARSGRMRRLRHARPGD